jgi:hypothetical protein
MTNVRQFVLTRTSTANETECKCLLTFEFECQLIRHEVRQINAEVFTAFTKIIIANCRKY